MKINKLDHFVLTVSNVGKTVSFYTTVLDMKKVIFGESRMALKFGAQKINLHPCKNTFTPKAMQPTPGSADFCLLTETPLNAAIAHVQSCGVEIIEGPVERTGTRGKILSFYIRDPDGNLIEIANGVKQN